MTLRDILKQTTFLYYGPHTVSIEQLALEWIADHAEANWPDDQVLEVSLQLARQPDGSIRIDGIGSELTDN